MSETETCKAVKKGRPRPGNMTGKPEYVCSECGRYVGFFAKVCAGCGRRIEGR